MPQSDGRFVWYELMTSEVEAAQVSYGHVVGWGITDAGMTAPASTVQEKGIQ